MDSHITFYLSHTVNLHSISYYPLHSTDANLYIPGNRPEALTVLTHPQISPYFPRVRGCITGSCQYQNLGTSPRLLTTGQFHCYAFC